LRTRPVLASSSWLVDSRAEELSRYVARGSELLERMLERSSTRITDLTAQLRALSPQRTLDRGYAIAQLPDGTALRAAKDAPAGTPLLLTVSDGRLTTIAGETSPADGAAG